ncbi:hypothetical protein [Streptomyces sp. NPDC001380]|uniref:hypothetical protein n=1 Tax=Streptomyces sp. NPDC001380 TaxID=3364566 RepID=UPI003685679A
MARPTPPQEPTPDPRRPVPGRSVPGRQAAGRPAPGRAELRPCGPGASVSSSHWPGAVCPPTSAGFQQSAKAWLFELAPARWWHEELLHRYPVELARMVRLRLEADVAAMHAGLRTVAGPSAAGPVPAAGPAARPEPLLVPVQPASELYIREREWARAMLEQVKLVEQALRAACVRPRRRRASAAASPGVAAGPLRSALPRQRPATG